MSSVLPPNDAPATMPRGALLSIGALVVSSLVAVAAVRISGMEIRTPDAPTVALRELRFEDRPDGSIAVTDARTEQPLRSITGENGFLRGTLRGLARERKRMGLGPEQPFELIGRADGRLTLSDPATGRRVDLDSFGPVNAGIFGELLTERKAP